MFCLLVFCLPGICLFVIVLLTVTMIAVRDFWFFRESLSAVINQGHVTVEHCVCLYWYVDEFLCGVQ